jgi:hypothetical protein
MFNMAMTAWEVDKVRIVDVGEEESTNWIRLWLLDVEEYSGPPPRGLRWTMTERST